MASVLKIAGGTILFIVFLSGTFHVHGQSSDTAPEMDSPPLFQYGEEHGDTKLEGLTDDKEVSLPANISYFGSLYNKLYVSVDGLISFEKGMRYFKSVTWEEGTRNENTDKPFLAPFLYDGFKTINIQQGGIYYRVMEAGKLRMGTKYYHDHMTTLKWLGQYIKETTLNIPDDFKADLVVVVTWADVATESDDIADIRACNNDPDNCKSATFQAVLVSDNSLKRTVAILNYLKMDIPIKSSYQAGFNGGYGRDWFNVIPCHGRCSNPNLNDDSYLSQLPTLKGSDLEGRFILDVGNEVVVRGGCLPDDFTTGILEVYPREISMFGGEKLEVSGKCRPMSSPIYCRFGDGEDSPVVEGIMINSMKGVCSVPLLTKKGSIFLAWSSERNADVWAADRTISVVLPSRTEPVAAVSQSVKDQWYSRDASEITVPWDPKKFTHTMGKVEIRLIGYRETETKVEYKTLENIATAPISAGEFTFNVADHRCKSNCMDFEQGLLEVSLPQEYLAIANERVAVRHGPITLGWYVNQKMTEDNGSNWSDQMCKAWFNDDSRHTDWLASLIPCPCSLDQALADFGRFQVDPGCDLFDGSKCTYHKGAKHCVRSVVPTKEGSGNQCCYNKAGQLVYSQLSHQGSTPDRSHAWGAAPYGQPDLVPSLSHWKHDVVSFYYCCLWNDYRLCDLYMERRPTQDCKDYNVPAIATLRGVPHVSTFDGLDYQMVGVGDFYLLQTQDLMIQGRFGARRGAWDLGTLSGGPSTWSAPVLKSVGIMYKSVFVDVHLAPENANPPRGLDIRVRKERRFFFTQETMWQDFDGMSIINSVLPGQENYHNNFTILTNNNVGINILSQNGLLQISVALPKEMQRPSGSRDGMGLLGVYDNNPGNDYTTKSGLVVAPGTSHARFLETFVLNWNVEDARNSLFPFFEAASSLDSEHIYARYGDIPNQFQGAPSEADIDALCGVDTNCKWDYRITGSPDVASSTKQADKLFAYIDASVEQVDSCGLPAVGRNAKMDSYDFSEGSEVTVTGCGERMSFAGSKKFECVKEPRSEAQKYERDDYGLAKTDPEDGVEYLIHWLPKPSVLCTDGGAAGGLELMWIICIAVAAVVLIIIIAVVAFIIYRRRKSSDKYSSKKPTPANRRSGGNREDDKSGHAMLPREVDRSPVYKPSREPVMLEGSTV